MVSTTNKQVEIFGEQTLEIFKNGSNARIFETFSELRGRCFIIELVDLEDKMVILGLKPGLKLDIFLLEKGEEVWLQLGLFPYKVSSAVINTMEENGPQVKSIFLIIRMGR